MRIRGRSMRKNSESFSWRCPYCSQHTTITESNFSEKEHIFFLKNKDGQLALVTRVIVCPNEECREYLLQASLHRRSLPEGVSGMVSYSTEDESFQDWQLKPQSKALVFPPYIPQAIRNDYEESCKIVSLSPKSSATLSRRCLQGMIRDYWGVTKKRLVEEINAIKDRVQPDVWDAIDGLRNLGNIGAHMEKDIDLIIEVDAGEAEALIGLIEMLVQEWYVNRHERDERLKKIKSISDTKNAEKNRS